MAVVRRATDVDATWARAWTADTFADLATIPDFSWELGPRHGDVAYVTDQAKWFTWRDDNTWEASGSSSQWSVLTNGNILNPELIFANGDAIMIEIP